MQNIFRIPITFNISFSSSKEYLASFTTNVLANVSSNLQSTFVKKKSKHCENKDVNQYLFNQLPSFAFTRF